MVMRGLLFLLSLAVTPAAEAQSPTPSPSAPIADNSFLLEEAYNQEPGVVQHISNFARFGAGDWAYTFTQEWPVRGQQHQLSVTVPVQSADGARGLGDAAVNYRYQAVDRTRVAVAPRLSLLLPTGSWSRGLGTGSVGGQVDLPVSVSWGPRVVSHSNLGATWVPRARNEAGQHAATWGWNAGQSVIWLARPTFNLLVEVAWTRSRDVIEAGTTRPTDSLYVSPGIRWAYNFESGLQIVPGVALPIGVGPSGGDRGVLVYLSFEHPFRREEP